jgi:hypothetical protein
VTCYRSMFFPGTPVSPTNKTDRHDIAEILFKVALNTITLTLHTREATQLYSCIILLDLFWFINGCFVDYNCSIYAASKENCGIHQLAPDGMLLNDDVLDEKCDQYKVMCYKKDGSEIYFCTVPTTSLSSIIVTQLCGFSLPVLYILLPSFIEL